MLDTKALRWERVEQPAGSGQLPRARNAASLVPAAPGGSTLVLHGGWKAFVESYCDTHLLEA